MVIKTKDAKLYFYGGLRTDLPAEEITEFECPAYQNIDPSADDFAVERRAGQANLSAAIVTPSGTQGASGAFVWINPADNTVHILFTEGQKIYKAPAAAGDVPVDITPVSGWTPTMDSEVSFASLKTVVVIMAKGMVPHKYDGTTVAALGGTPPTTLWKCVSHQGRIHAFDNAAGRKNMDVWSAIGEPEQWDQTTYADNAGEETIGDGAPLTGFVSAGDILYFFKDNSAHFMTGGTISNAFNFRGFTNKGLVSPFGATAFDDVPIWASHEGILAWSPRTGRSSLFSQRIHPDYRDLSEKSKIMALKYDDQVIFIYSSTGSQYRLDETFVCRVRHMKWAKYTNQVFRAAASYVHTDGLERLIGVSAPTAAGNSIRIKRLDTGTDDGGTAIPVVLETKDFSFAHRIGRVDSIIFETENNSADLTVKYYLEKVLQATALTPSYQPGTPGRFHGRIKMPLNSGFSSRIQFTETITGAGFGKLFGMSYNLIARERGVPL